MSFVNFLNLIQNSQCKIARSQLNLAILQLILSSELYLANGVRNIKIDPIADK